MKPKNSLQIGLIISVIIFSLGLPARDVAAQETSALPGQFAYVENGTRLYLVHGDVNAPSLLVQAEDPLVVENPRFSRDGRYLAYCIHDPAVEDYPRLLYMDTLSLEEFEVTTEGSCSYDWWEDGKTLVFSTPVPPPPAMESDQGLWSYTLETGALEVFIRTEAPVIDPRWSPDGRTLSFFDYCFECVGKFYTYDLITQVTMEWAQGSSDWYPGPDIDWSPDGMFLAADKALWISAVGGETYGLDIASSDGETWKEIYSQPGKAAFFPIWSPDGTRIAFASFESFTIGNYVNRRADLMTVASDGSDAQKLYTSFYEIFPQAWSPDGSFLLFVEPLTVATDALQRQQLVLLEVETGSPVWKISSFNPITADWAPVPVLATPTVAAPPAETPAVEAAGTGTSIESGETPPTGNPAPTDSSDPLNLQSGLTGLRSTQILIALLLCCGVLIGLAFLIYILLKRLLSTGKRREPPVEETRVEEVKVEETIVEEATIEEQPAEVSEEPATTPAPEDVDEAFRRGRELVHNGQAAEGILELQKVVAVTPENQEAWFWLGIASARQKDHRAAERCFLQAKKRGHPEADKALEWLKQQKY